MFLDGQIDHWQCIMNYGDLGVFEMNREAITSFTYICLEHMMYLMIHSYYLNMSWSLSTAWDTFKLILDETTRSKIFTSRNLHLPALLEMYHPCQLEKKYGGTAETPTNYWPPYVGKYFVPEGQADCHKLIKDSDYERILQENPLLQKHPSYLSEKDLYSRDFVFDSNNLKLKMATQAPVEIQA